MFRIVTKQCMHRLSLVRGSQLKFAHKPNFLTIASCNQFNFSRNESTSVPGIKNTVIPTTITNQETIVASQGEELVSSHGEEELVASHVEELSGVQEAITNVTEFIPEPPVAPLEFITPAIKEAIIQLEANGDPTLASVGLGGWSPSGLVQNCLHYLHCDIGMPWCAAILAGTIVVRFCLFPLVIKSQRNSAKMTNNMPQMQALQVKMTEARNSGNAYMAAKYTNEMVEFMKEKELNPLKQVMVPLAMMPVFMSFFFGLRGMANLPLESLKTGGLAWFTDLTVCDPYYILPVITCCTLLVTIELGIDGAKIGSNASAPMMKYIFRCMPLVIFPFVMHFPTAIVWYWSCTNVISLCQVGILRIPAVRDKFKIDRLIKHDKAKMPIKNQGFVKSCKESWTNMKITKQMEDRERHDALVFKRAGIAPIPKTYKYDPTKVQPPTVGAKGRAQ